MPRIANEILNCSIYLYKDQSDAQRGVRNGGSGFLVALRKELPNNSQQGSFYLYAVSNRHVIKKNPVIRLNKKQGDSHVIDMSTEDWEYSDSNDVAITPINFDDTYNYLFIDSDLFVTSEKLSEYDIGPGDEVFMIGRFISFDGIQKNHPSVRTGHLSMLPNEAIYHPSNNDNLQEAFIVEMRSIKGYSGSPVFVRPVTTNKVQIEKHTVLNTVVYSGTPSYQNKTLIGGPWLLGIAYGNLNSHDQNDQDNGMTGVVPAWHIMQLLESEKQEIKRNRQSN